MSANPEPDAERLREASEALREAAIVASGDRKERIESQAESIADLAERDRGPDQGRLDRHMNALRDLSEPDDEVAEEIGKAYEHLEQYRMNVGGV